MESLVTSIGRDVMMVLCAVRVVLVMMLKQKMMVILSIKVNTSTEN